jgi:hypothetical protein
MISSYVYSLHNYLITNQQPRGPLDIQKHPIFKTYSVLALNKHGIRIFATLFYRY